MLPVINLLSWLKVIKDLAQFEIIRKFLIVFSASLLSLRGFLSFFFLILFAFTSTEAIIKKFNLKQQQQDAINEIYSADLNQNYNENVDDNEIFKGIQESFLTLWKTVLQGDYEINGIMNIYNIFITLAFTLIPNVVLLNLIVAILGESYEETITSIEEKCLREQVYLILRYEALTFPSRRESSKDCYVWVQYVGQTVDIWVSQVDIMIRSVQKSIDLVSSQIQDKIADDLKKLLQREKTKPKRISEQKLQEPKTQKDEIVNKIMQLFTKHKTQQTMINNQKNVQVAEENIQSEELKFNLEKYLAEFISQKAGTKSQENKSTTEIQQEQTQLQSLQEKNHSEIKQEQAELKSQVNESLIEIKSQQDQMMSQFSEIMQQMNEQIQKIQKIQATPGILFKDLKDRVNSSLKDNEISPDLLQWISQQLVLKIRKENSVQQKMH